MDKNYWENYYKAISNEQIPSLFAQFVLNNYTTNGGSLLELGCGNGRDSIFFAQNGLNVLAVDQCEEEINVLQDEMSSETLNFKTGDFTALPEIGTFDTIYSRFTLHSISEQQEDRVINWSYKSLSNGGYLCIEARGHKNELYKLGTKVEGEEHAYIYNDHYRRFVELDTLIKKLEDAGFTVELSEEKNGFAPYNDTDYIFIRVIAHKK